MTRDQARVKADFLKLKSAHGCAFPPRGGLSYVPHKQGVYIIYSPRAKTVVHVGRTYRATAGLRQRLENHLHAQSSFTNEFLKGHGRKLRKGYTFRYLTVTSGRRRALLEAYTIGCLCPVHLGTHGKKLLKEG